MNDFSSFSVALPADFSDKLSSVIRRGLEISGWRFSYEGQEFTAEEVAAPDGMLPMWIHQAQGLMAEALGGEAPGMTYRIDGMALCGVLPAPQSESASLPVWACFVHYALEQWRADHKLELTKGQPAPMDVLYQKWRGIVTSNQVELLPALPMPSAAMGAFAGGYSGSTESAG